MYQYTAIVVRVIDGDTVDLSIDLGLDTVRNIRCRLFCINAPEMRTNEGKAAREHLYELLGSEPVTVHTIKDRTEKYGRYLVKVYRGDSLKSVNAQMVEDGHAVRYMIDEGVSL